MTVVANGNPLGVESRPNRRLQMELVDGQDGVLLAQQECRGLRGADLVRDLDLMLGGRLLGH